MENVLRSKYEKAVANKFKTYRFIKKDGEKGVFEVKRNLSLILLLVVLLSVTAGFTFGRVIAGPIPTGEFQSIVLNNLIFGMIAAVTYALISKFQWIKLKKKDLDKLLVS